jgi:hypothetical protein
MIPTRTLPLIKYLYKNKKEYVICRSAIGKVNALCTYSKKDCIAICNELNLPCDSTKTKMLFEICKAMKWIEIEKNTSFNAPKI